MRRVLVVWPNDFRLEARERFEARQRNDLNQFATALRRTGSCEVMVMPQTIIDPGQGFQQVAAAIKDFRPDRMIIRSYLWADPPNGMAPIQAAPRDMPIAASCYSAPPSEPLGEAPGEVFMLHITACGRHIGREVERLFGPLSGPESDQNLVDLQSFVRDGVIPIEPVENRLTITPAHTQRAQGVLAGMQGTIIATTGSPAMGMTTNRIIPHTHFGAWGMLEPIMSPDLAYWLRRFQSEKERYLALGRHYVNAMVTKGFKFLFQQDWDGRPLPSNERDYTPEVAAFQMGLYACMLDICEEMGIGILGIPAQLLMTDFITCGDLLKGAAMSSWGPEGREGKPLHWMTEGDIDGGVSHRILWDVTGHAPAFADVRCPIPDLGPTTWMMNNSGAACADMAEGGYGGCFSVRQYRGYFRAPGGGGTFAFKNPKRCEVVGFRVGSDPEGVFGTIAIGETVRSDNPAHFVDARWPQLRVKIFAGSQRQAYRSFVTNHKHWSESDNSLDDAAVIHEVVRLAAGGDPNDPGSKRDRVTVLFDQRRVCQR